VVRVVPPGDGESMVTRRDMLVLALQISNLYWHLLFKTFGYNALLLCTHVLYSYIKLGSSGYLFFVYLGAGCACVCGLERSYRVTDWTKSNLFQFYEFLDLKRMLFLTSSHCCGYFGSFGFFTY